MPDIRERFGTFDRLDVPDLWDDAQRREPSARKGPGTHERARKAVVIVATLAVTIAATTLLIGAFNRKATQPVVEPPNGWSDGTIPALGLAFRYPSTWRVQPFDDQMHVTFEGALISNTDREFHHPDLIDGATTAWDLSDLPDDGVVVSIERITGGPPDVGAPPADTPLPLHLTDATLLSQEPDPLGSSPKPPGTEERYLDFVLNGREDTVRIFFGPDVSIESRRATAELVASIRGASNTALSGVLGRPVVQVPDLVGMHLGDARDLLRIVDLHLVVTYKRSSLAAGTVVHQHPKANSLFPPGESVYLVVSRGRPNGG